MTIDNMPKISVSYVEFKQAKLGNRELSVQNQEGALTAALNHQCSTCTLMVHMVFFEYFLISRPYKV